MIKINDKGQITLYVMEPEEEAISLRYIHAHKPGSKPRKYVMSPKTQAKRLGLKGGYDGRVLNLLWEEMTEYGNNTHKFSH